MKSKTKTINVFGKINKEIINHFTPPYAVRNDCRLGQWKIGDDKLLGNTLDLSVIAIKPFYGILGKTKGQWLQVWFVGTTAETKIPQNTVCVTYVKTQSLSALGQKAIEIMETEDPANGIFTTSFSKHAGDYGDYYSIVWNWRPREEQELKQLELIADFLETKPSLVDPNLTETMIELSDGANPIDLVEAQKQIKLLEEAKSTLIGKK